MTDGKTAGDRRRPRGRSAAGSTDATPVDRRKRRHEAKRARIVAEAWELARRDGLASISLRDLADRVDLRQPSLYAYFESKLALYDAMFIDGYRQLLDLMARHPAPDDPREALVEFVELCVRFAAEDVVRHQLLFQRTVPGFTPSPEAREVTLGFLEIGWQRLIDVGVTDVASADIFTAIVVGFTHQQVFNDPRGERWLLHVRRAVEMFLADVEGRSRSDGRPDDLRRHHPREPDATQPSAVIKPDR
jgi:AcrR family transcriptional regulator